MVAALPNLVTRTAPLFTGVRQRMIVVSLAASLAVLTQPGPPPGIATGATGSFEATFALGDEQIRLACEGSGQVSVLFLAETAAGGRSVWNEARERLTSLARVCTVETVDDRARDDLSHPDRAERVAASLAAALRDADIPSPYVMVGPESSRAVAGRLLPHAPGLVAGSLLIDISRDPVTGSIADASSHREISLNDADAIVMALRSLIWPPRSM